MGTKQYIRDIFDSKAGLHQLLCHENKKNFHTDELTAHGFKILDPLTSVKDYETVLAMVDSGNGLKIAIPHMLQSGHGFSHPSAEQSEGFSTAVFDEGLKSIKMTQEILKRITVTCKRNDNYIVSIDTVHNEFDLQRREDIIAAVKPLVTLSLYITSYMAYIEDDVVKLMRNNRRGNEELPSPVSVYRSERGKNLLCQSTSDKPILTAENYGKWYDLYVLFPDGSVKGLGDLGISKLDVPGLEVGTPVIDHNFHPELFRRLATANDWYIHDVSLEVTAGRWALEHHDQFNGASYYPD